MALRMTTTVMFDGELLTVLKATLPMIYIGGFRLLGPEGKAGFRKAARESDGKVKPIHHPVYQDEILRKQPD